MQAARQGLLRTLCRGRGARVLDMACGDGADLLAVAQDVWLGVGLQRQATALEARRQACRERGFRHLHFALGDGVLYEADPGLPRHFDLVVLSHVLGDAGHRRSGRLLSAAARRIGPGGRVLVVEPNINHPAVAWLRFLCRRPLQSGLSPPRLRPLAWSSGLEPTACYTLPWAPDVEDLTRLAARPPLVQALARLPLAADGGCFAMVLRQAG